MQTKIAIVLTSIWLAGLAGISAAVGQSGEVAVVVNAKNPINNLSNRELRQIFAGERRSWSTNLPIKLVVRAPGARERIALLKLLGMTESEYKQYWTAQVFRGQAQSEPLVLFSSNVQKQAIEVFPGAVALMQLRDVGPGMKVVKVEGHMPGQTGYPLN